MIKTRKLRNFLCFINDLSAINDAGIFESNLKNMYPEKLELRRENGIITEATLLDLDIKIKNNKFQI